MSYLGISWDSGAGCSLAQTEHPSPFVQNPHRFNLDVNNHRMIALYASLSHPPGLLLGWMNLAGGTASGDLFWITKAARSADYYTNGFTNTLAVVGSLWTNPPAHTVAASLSDGQLPLTGGGLADLLAFNPSINKAAIGWLGWS